jgi:hypothetical protein
LWKSVERLEKLLQFPRDREQEDWWDHVALTDPPGGTFETALLGEPRIVPSLSAIDRCRVYVISYNPIFPIEWRDEAYRIILPEELASYHRKWRTYVAEVQRGHWRQYLHQLYLFDRIHYDEHQYQQFEDLVRLAHDSLTRTSAWCKKERFVAIREEILRTNLSEHLQSMRPATPIPRFDPDKRHLPLQAEQLEKEKQYRELRDRGAAQIKEWNRRAPQNWKLQFPIKMAFEDLLRSADDSWLKTFFAWCDYLVAESYGLFLWA